MKKTFLSIALAVAFCSCEAQHQVTVKFTDLTNDTISATLLDKSLASRGPEEKIVAKDGQITYDVDGQDARILTLNYKAGGKMQRMQVTVVPGEQGIMTITGGGGTWSGSKFYADLAAFEAQIDPIQYEMNAIVQDYQKKMAQGANRDALQKEIMPKYEELEKKMRATHKNYVLANPDNEVSATLLVQLGVEDAEECLAKLTDKVKNGRFAQFVTHAKNRVEKEKARMEAAKKVGDGQPAPDFTLKNLEGKDMKLSDLRGKYVVLDFWGSWCGWCIKGFPEMKKYYEKYKSKMEILGVDCNDTEQKWKDAVKKHELPWKHVYCPRSSNVLDMYAITGFPTKLVIDPKGNIVKTIVGEDPAFYTFLDEVLK